MNQSHDEACRWGIMGTASIARKNWKSIWNAENATLVAVASLSMERANQFIDECQSQVPFADRPRALDGYEAIIEADDVDAIYLPLPTGIRKEWVIRAAEKGKHVLVEKPCGVNASEVEEIVEACRANNVQFMDGVMFMHSDRLPAMRKCLNDSSAVGELRRITSQFSFMAPEEFMQSNIRVSHQLEPLGCLGDLGWYNIRLTLWVMDWQLPEEVTGRLLTEAGSPDSDGRVPMEFSGEMIFPGGVSASMYCAFVAENQQWANISGTNGHLQIDDFVLPYFGYDIDFAVTNAHFEVNGCDFDMQPRCKHHHVAEYSNGTMNSQEAKMIHNFSANVLSGKIDPQWSEIALKTQIVLDRLLAAAR